MQFQLLAKPAGSSCNLDCSYCFYLSKAALYPEAQPRMSEEVLERYLRQLFAASAGGEVSVAWQGGEPTLMGLRFFERAVALADEMRSPGQVVHHSIQTNGVLLDDAWCTFLNRNGFLVGLSIDGPRWQHDAYRVAKGGRGTFDGAVRAWKLLRRHGVDVNILCAVHAANAGRPREVYRFFRDELHARHLQFIPIVERNGGEGAVTRRSVDPETFGRFLVTIFDEWLRRDVGKVFVQMFDAYLGNCLGMPNLCIFAHDCAANPVLEHNGDLYSCDHFVDPDHLLGNIGDSTLGEMIGSEKQRTFGSRKVASLPRACHECEFLFACEGECPRNRFVRSADGEPGMNYLCAGYRAFFAHAARPMAIMAELLRAGRPTSEVARYYGSARENQVVRTQ
ncbi:MAG TPA: anaerobic sulfatase maturase [Thermoanaerobaculia bacterium]|nr:anaerobic sulfatase maturase [Thermoanaerobaculia bacterium]